MEQNEKTKFPKKVDELVSNSREEEKKSVKKKIKEYFGDIESGTYVTADLHIALLEWLELTAHEVTYTMMYDVLKEMGVDIYFHHNSQLEIAVFKDK